MPSPNSFHQVRTTSCEHYEPRHQGGSCRLLDDLTPCGEMTNGVKKRLSITSASALALVHEIWVSSAGERGNPVLSLVRGFHEQIAAPRGRAESQYLSVNPVNGSLGQRDQPHGHVDAMIEPPRGSHPPRSAGCARYPGGSDSVPQRLRVLPPPYKAPATYSVASAHCVPTSPGARNPCPVASARQSCFGQSLALMSGSHRLVTVSLCPVRRQQAQPREAT